MSDRLDRWATRLGWLFLAIVWLWIGAQVALRVL